MGELWRRPEKVISRARIVDVKYIVNIGFERALHFYVPNQ